MSVVEFGLPTRFQQKSTQKWKIRVDDTFLVYLGAPDGAEYSQGDISPVAEKIREACKKIVSTIPQFARMKVHYEKLPGMSFVNPFPSGFVIEVKTRIPLKTRTLKENEIPPAARTLVQTLTETLPQYDMTLRTKRTEFESFETVADDWDKRDPHKDDSGGTWNNMWLEDFGKYNRVASPSDLEKMSRDRPGAAGDGYVAIVDKDRPDDSNRTPAIYFSTIECETNQLHPRLKVLKFFGNKGKSNLVKIIVFKLDNETVNVQIRETVTGLWDIFSHGFDVEVYFNPSDTKLFALEAVPGDGDVWTADRMKKVRLNAHIDDVVRTIFNIVPITAIGVIAGLVTAPRLAKDLVTNARRK